MGRDLRKRELFDIEWWGKSSRIRWYQSGDGREWECEFSECLGKDIPPEAPGRAKATCFVSEHRFLQMKSSQSMTNAMALKSEVLLLSGQMLSLKPPRPREWHLDSGWDYICVAVWIVPCCQTQRPDFQEEKEPVFLDTTQEVPPVQQNALPISSALQKGNSGKHDFPLKVFTVVFGWFVLVLWVITDNNSTAGNLIIQVALPHFVWVKSVFSSLWVQLILTKRGAVCNHTSFPHHLPGWSMCLWDSPKVSIMPHYRNSHFNMSLPCYSPLSTDFQFNSPQWRLFY